MTYPTFTNGQVLPASDLNAIGLWLVKSQALGTGVSSVTVTGAFSADYDNYRIEVSGVVCSTTGVFASFQVGGQTANYYGSAYYDSYAGSSTGTVRVNNGSFVYTGTHDNNNMSMSFDVMGPNLAKITNIHGNFYGGNFSGWFGGTHAVATAYTSMTLVAGGGTFTGGTIRVYGYRN